MLILKVDEMKDILRIQYKGVEKQQLLSIGSISNCNFMKVFPLYGVQSQNILAVGPSSSYHKNIKT